jgi:hypothetical protein
MAWSNSMIKMGIMLVAALSLVTSLPAQDRMTTLLNQYQHEADPARKARNLAKLGSMQIDIAKQQLKDGEDVKSLDTLQMYRDEVKQTVGGLIATKVDAEKKPAGFKELQIALRESVRRIDDLILSLPVDKRPFFREVRTDLVAAQNTLIDVLFPRTPDRNPDKSHP